MGTGVVSGDESSPHNAFFFSKIERLINELTRAAREQRKYD